MKYTARCFVTHLMGLILALLVSRVPGACAQGTMEIPPPASQSQPAGGAAPVAPPASGGLLDTLKKADEQRNQAPAAPEAPKSQ